MDRNRTGFIDFYENIGTSSSPEFIKRIDLNNPLDMVDLFSYYNTSGGEMLVAPAFCDIDMDGDFDAFIGTKLGHILFYKNIGTPYLPIFIEQNGSQNLFDGIDVGAFAKPAFTDMDGDGDCDIFISGSMGLFGEDNIVHYYENIGPYTKPSFFRWAAPQNTFPFPNVLFHTIYGISLADIDNDGDQDAFVGIREKERNENNQVVYSIRFYENLGDTLSAIPPADTYNTPQTIKLKLQGLYNYSLHP